MKAALIYYSLEGNMDYVAKEIGRDNLADLIQLTPEKEYPTGKISKFIWGGKSVTFGEKPKLINKDIDLSQYDTLIIGSPVWAGTFTPPLNTFLHNFSISGKNIILVATHGGGGADKCFQNMKSLLPGNTVLKEFQFANPKKTKDDSTKEQINQIRQMIS
jgi:Flavodoxins